jgi:CubicO group peptidase (beta-lactamase class C family)
VIRVDANLDDPVSRYLPWFKTEPTGDDDGPIRIEHLLTHGSGLPREAAFPHWTTFEFPTASDIRKTVAAQHAAFAPDTRWKNSNLAFALAGMAVEEVSGELCSVYLGRQILDPLRMTASSLDVPVEDLAIGCGRHMPDGRASGCRSWIARASVPPPA